MIFTDINNDVTNIITPNLKDGYDTLDSIFKEDYSDLKQMDNIDLT